MTNKMPGFKELESRRRKHILCAMVVNAIEKIKAEKGIEGQG